MPTLLRVEGFRFFFFSTEGREPSHVHVSKGDGAAELWLAPVRLAYAYGLTPTELRRVRELTRDTESIFVERWHEAAIRRMAKPDRQAVIVEAAGNAEGW